MANALKYFVLSALNSKMVFVINLEDAQKVILITKRNATNIDMLE